MLCVTRWEEMIHDTVFNQRVADKFNEFNDDCGLWEIR